MKTRIRHISSTVALLIFAQIALWSHGGNPACKEHDVLQKSEGLRFIENKGQWNSEDLYRAEMGPGTIQMRSNGLMLSIADPEDLEALNDLNNAYELAQAKHQPLPTESVSVQQQAWFIRFEGMQSSCSIKPHTERNGYYNYFLGNDSTHWASEVKSYAEIKYEGLYPQIDAIFYENQSGELEYDFHLHPGASVSKIRLSFTGLDDMRLNEKGELVIRTFLGEDAYPKPIAWQEIEGQRKYVEVQYLLDNMQLGFSVGQYDPSQQLIIDPLALRWAVYVSTASTATGHNHGIEVDEDGNIFVGGRSASSNFPTTTGVFQTTYQGGSTDIFVTKLIQSDTINGPGSMAWSTFIGGSSADNLYAIKTDTNGYIFITGVTSSSNYPTTAGAYDVTYGGAGDDAVVTKINSTGSALGYSTFLGSTGQDAGRFIYVTPGGIVYVVGETTGSFPVTAGCHQAAYGGGSADAFMAKLNLAGSALLYSTYYGGSDQDYLVCVRASSTGNLVMCGYTQSATSIATAGSFQSSLTGAGSDDNGFVVKFSIAPSISRTWATYFNPAAGKDMSLTSLQTDASENVYVGGFTDGASAGCITAGVYQSTFGGVNDLYVGKLNPTGNSLLAGTYVGGSGDEYNLMGLNIDQMNEVYVLGYTTSTSPSLPTTTGALQTSNYGGKDAFFFKISSDLSSMRYLTYWGGTRDEDDPVGYDGVKFSNCRAYTAITTRSSNAPMTKNAFHATRTSINIDEPAVAVWSNPPDLANDTFSGNESLCYGTRPTIDILGGPASYLLSDINRDGAITAAPSLGGISYQWQKSTDMISWTDIPGATTQNLPVSMMDTLYQTTYYVRTVASDFCAGSENVITKTVWDPPVAGFDPIAPACAPLTANFNDISTSDTGIASWYWHFEASDTSLLSNPSHTFNSAGSFPVLLIVEDLRGCIDSFVSTVLTTSPTPVTVSPDQLLCPGDSFQLSATPMASYHWYPGSNISNALISNPYVYPRYSTLYWLESFDSMGCVARDSVWINVIRNTAHFRVDSPCLGDSSLFVDLSRSNISLIDQWSWDFGDPASGAANTSSVRNPAHVYTNSGTHTVHLTITDSFGCVKDTFINITVHELPIANFTADSACLNQASQFTDLSTDSIISWNWDFGGGSFSTLSDPSYIFGSSGSHSVHLTVANRHCSADTSLPIWVRAGPTAAFNPGNVCMDSLYSFSDLSLLGGGPIVAWTWHFGDGDSSNSAAPTHSYDVAGDYNVQLFVEDIGSCTDSASGLISVISNRANFSVGSVCAGLSSVFSDLSSSLGSSIQQWSWNFGDPSSGALNSSSLQNPTHIFSSAGTYTVRLEVSDSIGCLDDTSILVRVYPIPTANFSADSVCHGDFSQMTDLSMDSIISWNWDFGDGGSSILANPLYSFINSGTQTVQLSVSDAHCSSDTILTVHVRPRPIADFNSGSVCVGDSYSFSDLSLVADGPITQLDWDLGDGSSAALSNPSHSYNPAGTYTVVLVIEDLYGCSDTAMENIVAIQNQAQFSHNAQCAGDSVQFGDLSFSNGSVLDQWNWNFDDISSGASNSSVLQNPIHIFSNAGVYTVNLEVRDTFGCIADTSIDLRIYALPIAAFEADSVCLGSATSFTDLSVDSILSWTWDFGDGFSSTASSPTHLFGSSGTQNVLLSVQDAHCAADTLLNVHVRALPIADFNEGSVCADAAYHFLDQSITADGPIENWNWDFGDGSSSGDNDPLHLYSSAGTYTVILSVIDRYGCADTDSGFAIAVENLANFSVSAICSGDSAFFNDLSFSNGSIISQWNWNFGDPASGSANSSNLSSPAHYYANAGSYTVTLEVRDTIGCIHDTGFNLIVYPKPVANFIADTVCAGNATSFVDLSYDSIISWSWDFGDGFTSSLQNPTHSYAGGNVYSVQLSVSSIHCTSSIQKDVWVHTNPIADFSFNNGCVDDPQFYSDASIPGDGSITQWNWNFGDGDLGSGSSTGHLYTEGGQYLVRLNIVDRYGCVGADSQLIVIDTIPVLQIWSDTVLCPGEQCWIYASGASFLQWEPGGEITDSLLVAPMNSESYTVHGVNGNCPERTATVSIELFNPPSIEAEALPALIVAGTSSQLSLNLSSSSDSIVWSPDSALSCAINCENPLASPTEDITYTATVYYDYESRTCPSMDTVKIWINHFCGPELVFIPNTFSPNSDGVNDLFYIRSVSIDKIDVFRIFDRWGQLVYEQFDLLPNDSERGWNGSNLKNVIVNSGVYVYHAEMYCVNGDRIEIRGNVSVVR